MRIICESCISLKEIIFIISMDSLCALCGVVKETKSDLEKHIIESHDGRTYSCEVCQKKCYGKKDLLNHMQMHQLITCTICSKDFKTRSFYKHKKHYKIMKKALTFHLLYVIIIPIFSVS